MTHGYQPAFVLDPKIPRSVRRPIEHLLGLTALDRIHRSAPEGVHGLDFLRWAQQALGVRLEIAARDLARIPAEGPCIVVANHPFGGIEGIVLGALVGGRRRDVRVMANYLLSRMPQVRDLFIPVDPFGGPEAQRRNLGPMRLALSTVRDGGALVVFPAGEVAHFQPRLRAVADPPWSTTVGRIARHAGCPVVPVHFAGRNGNAFQLLGLLHPRLRTVALGRALLDRRGKTIEVRVGRPIPYQHLESLTSDAERVAYIRGLTDVLGERATSVGSDDATPVQPRITPSGAVPLIEPVPVEAMRREIDRLPLSSRLVDSGDQVVYIAKATEIPETLREIGRLREATFRSVGEGTGRELDLDAFDRSYLHLFIWNHTREEIAGAYRLGRTDRIVEDVGPSGLYTSTLFDYKAKLFESMGPALEMGRSFIRVEYQKSYAALLLLWKGIGHYVVANPRYATLFGPVSISADYQSASQRLMASFLRQNRYEHEWSRFVRPHTPPRAAAVSRSRLDPAQLRNLDDVSRFIGEIESDNKGVPILLKQYLRLGGRLLGFNVDPNFSNVLDVLILVDLRQTPRNILTRTMGRDGVKHFLAAHGSARDSVSNTTHSEAG